MNKEIMIGNHKISEDSPTFVIAEMSANHLMDFDRAVAIMQAAKDAGADAIKIQTYTPDTITLDCDDPCFQITQGTIWDGTTLHKLYETAYTPWEWQPKLKKIAEEMGLVFFSSPFDLTIRLSSANVRTNICPQNRSLGRSSPVPWRSRHRWLRNPCSHR